MGEPFASTSPDPGTWSGPTRPSRRATQVALQARSPGVLPPTVWLRTSTWSVLCARVRRSLKGNGSSTENAPSVDWARFQPSPSGSLTPTRWSFMKTPPPMSRSSPGTIPASRAADVLLRYGSLVRRGGSPTSEESGEEKLALSPGARIAMTFYVPSSIGINHYRACRSADRPSRDFAGLSSWRQLACRKSHPN